MRLSEQLLELVSVFKEASKNSFDFSLELSKIKTLKPFAPVKKVLI